MIGFKKKGKSHTKAVKTVVDGIQFQSKLEVYVYHALKAAKIPADYEKHSYVLIQGFKSGIETWTKWKGVYRGRFNKVQPITYKPDFVCPTEQWVIEVKGRKFPSFMMRWKLFLRHLTMREMNTTVYLVSSEKEAKEAIIDIQKYFK